MLQSRVTRSSEGYRSSTRSRHSRSWCADIGSKKYGSSAPSASQGAIEQLITAFRHDFVNIRVVSDIGGENLPAPAIVDYMGLRVLNLVASPERGLALLPKVVFDRVFALLALLALAPLMIIIALVVKSTSPGPAIFRQYRKGVDGRVFAIYKFRTMRRDADLPGTVVQARINDPRVTRTGHVLRRTSLDELPQFFNVLKGDMSVVGPRPHAIEHDDDYKDLVQNYMYRYRVKPGITGLAQISGFRGETSQTEKMTGRVRLDIHYIRHRTFWLDLKIIALPVSPPHRARATANAVARKRDRFPHDGHAHQRQAKDKRKRHREDRKHARDLFIP